MGIAIPQVITPSKASGAQVIDGSLKFDQAKSQHLTRTFSAGNRRTWTHSSWVRQGDFGRKKSFFMVGPSSGLSAANYLSLDFDDNDKLRYAGGAENYKVTSARFRDTGWYHVVWTCDTTEAAAVDRTKIYVNGELITAWSTSSSNPSQNFELPYNENNKVHRIGTSTPYNNDREWNDAMSQVYFIDGAALGPENFGFTDPLTNTWKPKKFDSFNNPNNGTTWSNLTTASSGSFEGSLPKTNLFDGIASNANRANLGTVGASIDIDFSSNPINVKNTISIWSGKANLSYSINGGAYVNYSDAAEAYKDIPFTGTLTSLSLTKSDEGAGASAIKIDGYVLLDGATDNSFYLPFDGNSPIGKDQSGNGNDFTPVNFGSSLEIDNPNVSGARPLLNTTQGGTQAGVGYFGSSENKVITVTVASKTGGGNAYFFDGVERDSLALIRGTTIRFDTTDSSNDSHPFKLSSTNADSSGGTEYTDGVAYFVNSGSKNGTDYVNQYSSHSSGFRGIKWTVPHNVSTTYYYCTVHSGMGEDGRLTSTTDETKADKFAWKCFFAFPGVGPTLDLSSVINQKSGGKALTVSGASASSVETHFYNKSIYFDGSNDNIKTESTSHFLSPAEYTLEGWINITSAPGNNQGEIIFDTGSGGNDPELNTFNNSGSLQLYESLSNNTSWDGEYLQTGRWYHFAQVVQGSSASDASAVHKIYIDGKLSLTNTINLSSRSASSIACIGSRTNDTVYGNFYLSDLRFYQIAKYTSNFVVPSTSPDILPDTPSGVSGSSKLTKITDGAVHFDGNGDYLEATSSTDFAFGTGDFTLEAYIYATSLPNTNNRIFCSGAGGSGDRTNFQLMVGSAGYLEFAHSTNYQTSNGLIGTNKWHHVAATREGTSLRMFIDGRLFHTGTSSVNVTENGGVTIGREFGYSSYFNGFISNARILKGTALYTDDFTVPARTLTNVTNTKLLCCQSNVTSGAAAVSPNISGINDGTVWSSTVTGPTRKEDRVANAFNGSTSGPGAIPAYPGTLTFAPGFTGLTTVKIYGYYAGSGVTLHVNGSQQSPSSGAFTLTISTSTLDSVVWTATNGFNYMRIDAIEIDSTVLIDPVVGPDDGNEAATTFNPFNTDINTVRGQESGYATLNPLINGASTLSDGNLTATAPSGSTHGTGRSTLTMDTSGTGKFYFEATLMVVGGTYPHIGVIDSVRNSDAAQVGSTTNCFSYFSTGNIQLEGASGVSYGDSFTVGDTIGCSLDCGSGELRFYKNGVDQGVAKTITSDYHACFAVSNFGSSGQWKVNFGQKPFKFSPPEGFQPLNAANTRPVKVISRPDQYVGVTTYVGTGNGTTYTDTSLKFKPDMTWFKRRDGTVNHVLYDSVRGYGNASNAIRPNTTGGESAFGDAVVTAKDNGFSVTGSNTTGINGSGEDIVCWAWKAGGNKNTFNVDDVGYASAAAAGLTGGTITPSGASVGTKQGFSIIKYTGTGTAGTISHGLLEQPKFVMIKDLKNANAWAVQHVGTTLGTGLLKLNATNKVDNTVASALWNSTAPTSSVFSVGTSGDVNYTTNSAEYITYLWHDVPGLQKFGSYESGGGTYDGPYIELGFKPAMVMVKAATRDFGSNWSIIDVERNKGNFSSSGSGTKILYWSTTDAEFTSGGAQLDILSNGFKVRNNSSDINDGGTYIYAAWAAAPTVDLYGGGANAR